MNRMIANTISAGAVTAAVREIVFGNACPIIPPPAATSTRKKVPSSSENSRRHSCDVSWKSSMDCAIVAGTCMSLPWTTSFMMPCASAASARVRDSGDSGVPLMVPPRSSDTHSARLHRQVAAAFDGDAPADPDELRLLRERPREQRLALAEGGRLLQQVLRDEPEHVTDLVQVARRVHPHQAEVVALRQDVRVDLGGP